MNITDYNFLVKLKTEKISCSAIPETVKEANYFENFVANNVIILEGTWKRGNISLNKTEIDYFENFLEIHFGDVSGDINRASNIKAFRNSKSRKTKTNAIVFLKGNQNVEINNQKVDLGFHTRNFGIFSTVLKTLTCEKLCFVENLYAFLNVEKVILGNYIFLHTYGRVGRSLIEKINVKEILVFSDYDFVGLNEYLKFKETFDNTSFFMPEDYDLLFKNNSCNLKKNKKETSQKPTYRVLNSEDKIVIKIRNQVFQNQRYLEQEMLLSE